MLTRRIAAELIAPAASLFTPPGNPIDLVSLADVKLELNISGTADDTWLMSLITRCSTAAATYCNRTFQPSLWRDQVWPGMDSYPWQLPPRIDLLSLSQWPILSLPSPAMTAPPQTPTLTAAGGGALSTAIYYVRTTYLTPSGETAGSLEARIVLLANQIFNVANPGPDEELIATGWNVYVGHTPWSGTLQNASPIGINSGWSLPTSGLITGAAIPNYLTIVENALLAPTPLAEDVDFEIDHLLGEATRFFAIDRQPKTWGLPIIAIYQAGFNPIPQDIQDAVILMCKGRWFGRLRDPLIRSQNAVGIYEAAYFFGTGPGGQGDLPVDVMAKLDRYRVPVMA